MKGKSTARDRDMAQASRALERAAARARELAERTGTPLYVLKDGHMVDLNRRSRSSYILRALPAGE